MTSFEYLAVLFSMLVGLAIARTFGGLLRIVERRGSIQVYWLSLLWTAAILQWTVFFWWFTFALSRLEHWSMIRLMHVFFYAGTLFFLLGLLYPDDIDDDFDMKAHFHKQRVWFFGGLLLMGLLDTADTLTKLVTGIGGPGAEGLPFWAAHMTVWLIGSAIALRVKSERFLGVFGSVFLFLTLMASFFSGDL